MNYPEIIRKILFWVCSGSRCRNVLYGCQFAILVFQWWLSGWLVRGESAVEHADVGSSDSESCWRRAAGLYDAEAARREDAAWHQSTARGRPAAREQHRADHCSLGKPRHSSVRQVWLLAWWPGTHSRILSAIQRAAQTILGVFLKHTCLCITSVSSALGVLNGYVLYISTHSLSLRFPRMKYFGGDSPLVHPSQDPQNVSYASRLQITYWQCILQYFEACGHTLFQITWNVIQKFWSKYIFHYRFRLCIPARHLFLLFCDQKMHKFVQAICTCIAVIILFRVRPVCGCC